jgi:predicted nucleic acid-binding protein
MLVDTDVLIDYLKGNPSAEAFVEQNIDRVSVSAMTVAELYQGIRNKTEKETLDQFVSELRVFSMTGDIAIKAGLLRNEYGKSHSSGLADCIIAATSVTHGMELATLNIKHFPMLNTAFTPYKKS